MKWTDNIEKVYFDLEKKPFDSGTFRDVFKGTSNHTCFAGRDWVVKTYKDEKNDIVGETVFAHCRKGVQAHHLAKKLADEAAEKSNGEFVLSYNSAYFGYMDGRCISIERFVPGVFQKHVNNDGSVCGDTSDAVCQQAECLAHYSFVKSSGCMMLLDVQGTDITLYDPEFASKDQFQGADLLFTAGNMGENAINKFKAQHNCNNFCKLLKLPVLK